MKQTSRLCYELTIHLDTEKLIFILPEPVVISLADLNICCLVTIIRKVNDLVYLARHHILSG